MKATLQQSLRRLRAPGRLRARRKANDAALERLALWVEEFFGDVIDARTWNVGITERHREGRHRTSTGDDFNFERYFRLLEDGPRF